MTRMSKPVNYVLEGITYQLPEGDADSAHDKVQEYWDICFRREVAEDLRKLFRWRCPPEVDAFLGERELYDPRMVPVYDWLDALSRTSRLSTAEMEQLVETSDARMREAQVHLREPGARVTLGAPAGG